MPVGYFERANGQIFAGVQWFGNHALYNPRLFLKLIF